MRKSKCIKNGHKRKVYSFSLLLFYNHSNLTIILDVYKNFHTYSDSDNGKKRVRSFSFKVLHSRTQTQLDLTGPQMNLGITWNITLPSQLMTLSRKKCKTRLRLQGSVTVFNVKILKFSFLILTGR